MVDLSLDLGSLVSEAGFLIIVLFLFLQNLFHICHWTGLAYLSSFRANVSIFSAPHIDDKYVDSLLMIK